MSPQMMGPFSDDQGFLYLCIFVISILGSMLKAAHFRAQVQMQDRPIG